MLEEQLIFVLAYINEDLKINMTNPDNSLKNRFLISYNCKDDQKFEKNQVIYY
jgi:hypothetical protein